MDLGETLRLISPELILLVTGMAILVADLVWPARGKHPERAERARAYWLPAMALVGLGTALVAALLLLGTEPTLVLGMMTVDPFALFFKILALVAVALVILAAVPWLNGRTPYRGEFYALLVFACLAICLASSAVDLISLYLGMEFLSITSYILAGYLRGDVKSNEAGIKYFLYGAVASAVMLYGMSLLYGATGATNLSAIAYGLAAGDASVQWLAVASIVLLLSGFGFKIVLAPFHQWAPDTYEGAPTPITAFLSVASKAAGFAILMRVLLTSLYGFRWNIGWFSFLMALSVLSMILGNLIALRQTNIKRMLAYSSIAQAGYILIGFVCLRTDVGTNFLGINGTFFYLLGYLFTNLTVFIAVIAFEHATGSTEIADYRGLVKRSPILAGVLLVGLLSLAAIPGTAGFLGKFLVFGSALQMNVWQTLLLAVVGILTSVVAAFYYLNVVRQIFFEQAEEGAAPIRVPRGLLAGLALTTVAILAIGLYPEPFIRFANDSLYILQQVF